MANGDVVDMAHGWASKPTAHLYLYEARHFVSKGDALNRKITLDVPVEHVQVLENGSLDLFYRVSSDNPQRYGTNESEHLRVKVEKARATLPVPKVVEANPPDVLDPSKVFDAAHVLIEYLGTAKDDILTYYWDGRWPHGQYQRLGADYHTDFRQACSVSRTRQVRDRQRRAIHQGTLQSSTCNQRANTAIRPRSICSSVN
jgi:hypothetical protein